MNNSPVKRGNRRIGWTFQPQLKYAATTTGQLIAVAEAVGMPESSRGQFDRKVAAQSEEATTSRQ